MRTLAYIMALLAFATAAQAQEQTLIRGSVEHGGFGGPVVKYARVNDQDAVMVGGRGGWIINHSLALGGGGYGVANDIDAPDEVLSPRGIPADIEFGYGGFIMEYIAGSDRLVHFNLNALIGAGGISFREEDDDDGADDNNNWEDGDTVFVLEPSVNAELNVTAWLRVNLGVSYLMVSGVDKDFLEDSDFSGTTASLTFKFGTF